MDPFAAIAASILGLIVGSFLNVVILRFDTGQSAASGRSRCFSCGKPLSWYELVPLISFIMLRGRCAGCGTRISWQYPAVELASALSFLYASRFLSIESLASVIPFALTAALLSLYIVIFVYDLRHKVIPDLFSYGAGLVALIMIAWSSYSAGAVDFSRVIAGPSLFLFFAFFWYVSKGRWMGLGDAKLALSIGWALGMWQGIAAILLSFWVGAALTLLFIAFERVVRGKGGLRMKSEIPFGPYMLVGFAICLLAGLDIQGIISFLAV